MRILIAPDKFKGSLTAVQAAEAVLRGLRRVLGDRFDAELCPIADGGEGTTEALVTALKAEWICVGVNDAIGRPIEARYGLAADGTAVMEMSAASGLAKVSDKPLQPESAGTFGTGQLLRDAIERGATKIIIGIGGSATNDGGIGMAQALGYRFLDDAGHEVSDLPLDFERVSRIAQGQPFKAKVLVACDVDNPLLGDRGATRVYGAQKGVKDFALFERRLARLNELVARDLGSAHANVPGAGAAGGLGFGLMSFCNATLVNGFDLIAEVLSLETRIQNCDLVITGEGRVDAQTLHGKGPCGVAAMARKHGRHAIAIAGAVEDSDEVRALFDHAFAIKPAGMPLAEAMTRGAELIEETVVRNADAFTKRVHSPT